MNEVKFSELFDYETENVNNRTTRQQVVLTYGLAFVVACAIVGLMLLLGAF